MANYHLNAKVISRGKGQSAIAAAAYRSGERLRDEQTDEQKFYQARAERIQFTDIMAPKDAPEWAHDRNALWNCAERAEKRKDAQLAREIEVSLPHELTDEQRERLVKDFARETFVRKGYAVDIAMHAPDKDSDKRNYHAHLMVPMRTLGPDGFAAKKDPDMNRREQLEEWREKFAHLTNRHLERYGHKARVDHRSLAAQGIDREPTMHVGYAANEIAARGAQSDRMDALQAILGRNEIRIDIKALEKEMRQLEQEKAEQQRSSELARLEAVKAAEAVRAAAAKALQEKREAEARAAESAKAQAQAEAEKKKVAAKPAVKKPKPKERPATPPAERPHSVIQIAHAAAEAEAKGRLARKGASPEARPMEGLRPPSVVRPEPSISGTVGRGLEVAGNTTRQVVGKGLQVADRATGHVMKLTDFVIDFLSGSTTPPAPAKTDMRALLNDPAARRQHQIAQVAAFQNEREAAAAIERIYQDMDQGKNLNAEDVRKLTPQHQLQILTFGDSGMKQIVNDARKRDARHWEGEERERE